MQARESAAAAAVRWQKLHMLQDHYSEFLPFLHDAMDQMGFKVSEIQEDIAKYIAYGPHYLMAEAQRGQAKTSIAAAYCVWDLIHHPRHRVLIVSGGGKQATDISVLIIRLITGMPELECLRPDERAGDRSSVEHFDIHHSLREVADKSPSVKCAGITANITGSRADLLLADDIEVRQNSATAVMRENLRQLTLEFTNVCSVGRIIWLGTPQSQDSVYNGLPGRGVTIRVWPGRYPTPEQRANYGDNLAPLLARRLNEDPTLGTGGGMLGDQGKPIEKEGTGWLDEQNLQDKELDQGETWFQLQHMLNTALSDALRYPLKPDRIILLDVHPKAPLTVSRHPDPHAVVEHSAHGFPFKLRKAAAVSPEQVTLAQIVTYIDPAGGGKNGDATAYATTAFLNSTIYLLDSGSLPGGYAEDTLRELARRVARFKPLACVIEKNMGFGAFREVFTPILYAVHRCKVEDDLVVGQKERRIIDTLEPIIGRGALVVTPAAIEQDSKDCAQRAPKDRQVYSLWHQLSRITRERGSLAHDDSLDALEGACRYWQAYLSIDEDAAKEKLQAAAWKEMMEDPLGHHRYETPKKVGRMARRLSRFN